MASFVGYLINQLFYFNVFFCFDELVSSYMETVFRFPALNLLATTPDALKYILLISLDQ